MGEQKYRRNARNSTAQGLQTALGYASLSLEFLFKSFSAFAKKLGMEAKRETQLTDARYKTVPETLDSKLQNLSGRHVIFFCRPLT